MRESTRIFGVKGADNFGVVLDGSIFRGRQPTEDGFKNLSAMGVKHIVNLRSEPYARDDDTIRYFGMTQILFAMVQIIQPDRLRVKGIINAILSPSNWPLYIHCAEGKDRTGAICGCIRATQGWDYQAEILPEMYSYGHNPIFSAMRETIETFIKEEITK